MIGGTEKTAQKKECIEVLLKVTEMWRRKKMYNKQSESSENLQHSWPAAVAMGGYTQCSWRTKLLQPGCKD